MLLYLLLFSLVHIGSIYRQQNKCNPKFEFGSRKVENIVEKGENAGYQHFSFSYNFFKSFL